MNNHYFKDVSHLDQIDIYRILELYEVTDQCVGHAVKKLLCPGDRSGGKTYEQDLIEARDSLNRRLQMIAEDKTKKIDLKIPERMTSGLFSRLLPTGSESPRIARKITTRGTGADPW